MFKELAGGVRANTLIAVDERVVLNEVEQIGRRHRVRRRMQVISPEC
jgi:hypothetical protein